MKIKFLEDQAALIYIYLSNQLIGKIYGTKCRKLHTSAALPSRLSHYLLYTLPPNQPLTVFNLFYFIKREDSTFIYLSGFMPTNAGY